MHEIVFGLPGRNTARAWLFQRDGKLGFNYALGAFEAKDGGQSSPLRVQPDDKFHFPIAWLGPDRLPDGEYRLDVEGGSKVYFRVKWESATAPVVTVHGQQFPPSCPQPAAPIGPENVGGINKATVKDALEAFGAAATQSGTSKPEAKAKAKAEAKAEPKPKPSGPTLEFGDKTRTVAEWAAELGLNPLDIYARLAQGCTVEQALAVPTRKSDALTGDRAGRAIELD